MKLTLTKKLFLFLLFLSIIAGGLVYWKTAYGVTRTWDGGGGDANWNTAANWSGDVAPGTSDIANFDNTCVSNCSPTINVAISVAGINMDALYTGTITQSTTNTITVGASNWVQAGGTFTGATGAITLNGTFTLSGGTFTAGAQTITAYSNWTYTTGTINPGTSTVTFIPPYAGSFTITGSHTLYNVTFNGANSSTVTIANGTTLTVNGTLTTGSTATTTINTGTLEAKGNIVQTSLGATGTATVLIDGTGAQTLTGGGASSYLPYVNINKPSGTLTLSGTIRTQGNWTYTAGTLDPGTSTVVFFPPYSGSQTITGSHALYNVTIRGEASSTAIVTIANGTTLTADGTLNLTGTNVNYPITINTGTLEAKGNITQTSLGASGSATILIDGTGAQTFTGGGTSAYLPNININKTTGTLTLSGTIRTNGNWTYTAGTIDPGTSTVMFFLYGGSQTITGSHALYNVTMRGGANSTAIVTIASGTTLTVNGTLNLTGTDLGSGYPITINTGTLEAKGNITQASAGATGTAILSITGPNDQTITSTGVNWPTSTWTINKSSGTVTLASNLTLGATQALNITSGTLSQGTSYNLTAGAITIASSGTLLNKGTGDLTLGGTLTNSGLVSLGAGDCGGTDDILIRSSVSGTQRSWNGSGTFRLYDVDVKDMAGSGSITAYTATNTGNNGANWTFNSTGCPAAPPAAILPTGTFTIPSGKINIR